MKSSLTLGLAAMTVMSASVSVGHELAKPRNSVDVDDVNEAWPVVGNGMTWTGTLEGGGPEYTYNGSLEAIAEYIKTIKPDFFDVMDDDYDGFNATTEGYETSALEARAPETPKCDKGKQGAYEGKVGAKIANLWNQYNYLKKLGSTACHIGAGKNQCVRISCSWNAAVWLCNGGKGAISRRCDYIAGYVANIINKCTHHTKATCWISSPICPTCGCKPIDEKTAKGKQWDTTGFSVIISADRC